MYKITAVLGVVLAAAPFILGYSDSTTALWTSLILGIGVASASVVEWISEGKDRREYWLMAAAGFAAIAAPFLLNFAGMATAFWTTIALGALLVVTAGYKLFYNDRSWIS
jgi:uncharacterized membrane protein HdeD (DUF308 family)